MTLRILTPLLLFAVAVTVFSTINRGSGEPAPSADDGNAAALRAEHDIQRVRETGDVSYYRRAEDELRDAPRAPAVLTELGTLALARHDFRAGLRYGLAARRAAPQTVKPLGVIVDAQVELGLYQQAAGTLQLMLD